MTRSTRAVRQVFSPARLTLAREFKGLTKEALGRRIEVTGAAIGQFEKNKATPNIATLDALAEALDVPVEFFRTGTDTGIGTPAYFRSLRSTTLGERRMARAFAQYVHQLIGALEHYVGLPDVVLEQTPVDPDDDLDKVEQVAMAVRRQWELPPTAPLPHVVRLLESNGIVVVRDYRSSHRVDAFSVPFSDRSVVVLSSVKGKHDRSRFDAAHELGHLVMHNDVTDASKEIEAQAHRFAGAFLMPATGIRDELPTSARDVRTLLELKQKWGASIAAILRRSKDLGRMTPEDYVNAMKAISARGWRSDEPGNLTPEEPVLLRRALDVAEADGHDLDEIAEAASLHPDFVAGLVRNSTDQRRQVRI